MQTQRPEFESQYSRKMLGVSHVSLSALGKRKRANP